VTLRTLPPTAAPLSAPDLLSGLIGLLSPDAMTAQVTAGLRHRLGVEHACLVSSGRAALTMILQALAAISPRRRVVVPAYTCFSVPAAVVRAGMELDVCDIDPDTLDFDWDQLEALISEATPLCVISTHLFGLPADVPRTRRLCGPRGVFVVEDAAQAFAVVRDGGWVGTAGDVGFFSFGRGKNVSASGGGAIVTKSAELGRALERVCAALPPMRPLSGFTALAEAAVTSLLVHPRFYWLPSRLPFLRLGTTLYSTAFDIGRLSGTQVGLLRDWETRAALSNGARASRVDALRALPGAVLPPAGSVCLRLPVVCRSTEVRDRLCGSESGRRLGLSPMYPTAVTDIPELHDALGDRDVPRARELAGRLLTVPVHPLVSENDIDAIAELIAAAQRTGGR
jgi:perosamine synthetase